jgi:hypothetical protein
MRYVPYDDIGGAPNVIVDGAGNDATILTLSHWPGSRVPPSLRADLSAEIAINYLEQPETHVDADIVSNNHLDQDGLMGVWALIHPGPALDHRDRLIDVARAGDFTWSHERDAARAAFAIGSLVETPSNDSYDALLPLVPRLLDDVAAFAELWTEEDEFLDATKAAIDDGRITIDEHADLDLAIVTMPPRPVRPYHRFTQRREAPLHPMAVFDRTQMTRIAYLCEQAHVVELRYESVVQFVSRPIVARPDLALLADRLDTLETSAGAWSFDGVGGLAPQLRLRNSEASSIPRDEFVEELLTFLAVAPPAWDPWTETGFR